MSHFVLLVIGPNPATQLAPFERGGDGGLWKCDWCAPGGRWPGFLALKSGERVDRAIKRDLEPGSLRLTHAVLMDGVWYEWGPLWFGIAQGDKTRDEWAAEFKGLLDAVPDDALLSIYDCHV